MVKLEFIRDMGNMIPYPVFHECNPGVFVQHEIGNLRLVPIFPVIPPTKEVEADEEDTVEPECEAYDNGLDPELDYPAIESECIDTEEEEDDGVLDVPELLLPSEEPTSQSYQEIEFIKVETT